MMLAALWRGADCQLRMTQIESIDLSQALSWFFSGRPTPLPLPIASSRLMGVAGHPFQWPPGRQLLFRRPFPLLSLARGATTLRSTGEL